MSINLLEFCDPETQRFAINKPCREGGFVRATDGRIAIEVSAKMFPAVGPPEGRFPRFDDVFGSFKDVKSWINLPPIVACDKCESTGEIKGDCEYCKGSGECSCACGDEHDCGGCNGTGKEYLRDCRDCQPIILGRRIKRGYAEKVAKLPRVVVGAATEDPLDLLYFKFTGGRGAVCPLREDA